MEGRLGNAEPPAEENRGSGPCVGSGPVQALSHPLSPTCLRPALLQLGATSPSTCPRLARRLGPDSDVSGPGLARLAEGSSLQPGPPGLL